MTVEVLFSDLVEGTFPVKITAVVSVCHSSSPRFSFLTGRMSLKTFYCGGWEGRGSGVGAVNALSPGPAWRRHLLGVSCLLVTATGPSTPKHGTCTSRDIPVCLGQPRAW